LIAVVTTKIAISPKILTKKKAMRQYYLVSKAKNAADKNIIWQAPVSQKFLILNYLVFLHFNGYARFF
jgi:hypothetical protein